MRGAIAGTASSIGAAAPPSRIVAGLTTASATRVIPIPISPTSMTSRFGISLPYELRNRMPTTAPSPAGPMMKKKFCDVSPRMSTAKPGPMAPSTPIRLDEMPR